MARIPKAPIAAEGKPSEKPKEKREAAAEKVREKREPAPEKVPEKVKEKREPAFVAAEPPEAAESEPVRRDAGRPQQQQQGILAALERLESQAQSSDRERKAENAQRARRARHRFWFELVAVVALAAAAYVLWGQLKIIHGQLVVLNGGLRPWIGLSGFETDPAQIASDQPFTVTYTIKNNGMTPAYHARGWFRADADDADMADAPAFPPCGEGGTECSDQFLWPAATFAMKQTVSADDMAKIAIPVNDRNQRLYLLGRVDYEDWAHNPHWTTVCLYYDPALKAVAACAKWNDTDQPPPGGR